MPYSHLILCCPVLLLPSIFPSIRVFSSELSLHIRWPQYWSFSIHVIYKLSVGAQRPEVAPAPLKSFCFLLIIRDLGHHSEHSWPGPRVPGGWGPALLGSVKCWHLPSPWSFSLLWISSAAFCRWLEWSSFIFLFKNSLQRLPWASLLAQMMKNLPAMQETWVQSLGWEDFLRREWQPTPVFLPGEFHRQRSLVATVYGIAKSWTWLSG